LSAILFLAGFSSRTRWHDQRVSFHSHSPHTFVHRIYVKDLYGKNVLQVKSWCHTT